MSNAETLDRLRAERTLRILTLVAGLHDDEPEDDRLAGELGAVDPAFQEAVDATLDGIARGWLESATVTSDDGHLVLNWNSTRTGERAMSAYRRRVSNPVS